MLHGSQVDHHTVLWSTNLPGKCVRDNQIVASFPMAKKYMIHIIRNLYSQMSKDIFWGDFKILKSYKWQIRSLEQFWLQNIIDFLPG